MRALLTLAAIGLLGLFAGLAGVGFIDHREARDAAIAREMLARHELLTPVLGGEPVFEKPLLGYALEMAGARITRGSPVGSRTLRTLAAVLLVALTGLLGARHLGARAGAAAAAALATAIALPLAARTDGTQLVATLLDWVACFGLANAITRPSSRWRLGPVYFALAAAGVMAGPGPALWPLAGVALVGWRRRDAGPWRRVQPLAGLALVLGAALPWYGAMVERHGLPFLAHVAAFPYAGAARDPWFAAPVRALGFLAVGFFPWSTLLAAAVFRALSGRFELRRSAHPPVAPVTIDALLLGWLVAAMLPMLFTPSAPITATLPALPAAALLAGRWFERGFDADSPWSGAVKQAAQLLVVSGTIVSLLLVMLSPRFGAAASELRLVAAFLLLSTWAPFLAAFLGRPAVAAALLALPVALGVPLAAWRTLPALEEYLSTRPVAEAFRATAPPGTPLLLLEPPPASLRLYAGSRLVEVENLPRSLWSFRGDDGFAYVALSGARASEVARAAAPMPIEILLRTPALALVRVRED